MAPLREQLDHERGRADRVEQQLEVLRNELAETRVTERVATAEAADLRRRLDTATEQLGEALQHVRLLTDQRRQELARRWWNWRRRD